MANIKSHTFTKRIRTVNKQIEIKNIYSFNCKVNYVRNCLFYLINKSKNVFFLQENNTFDEKMEPRLDLIYDWSINVGMNDDIY